MAKNFKGTCYYMERKSTGNKTAPRKLRRPKKERLRSRITAILSVRKGIKMPNVGTRRKYKQKTKNWKCNADVPE